MDCNYLTKSKSVRDCVCSLLDLPHSKFAKRKRIVLKLNLKLKDFWNAITPTRACQWVKYVRQMGGKQEAESKLLNCLIIHQM